MNIDLPSRLSGVGMLARLPQSAADPHTLLHAGGHCDRAPVCRKVLWRNQPPREDAMPAYVIGDIRVTNSAEYDTYVPAALATITQYGGRVLAAGGALEALEGGAAPERTVVIEFANPEAARRWYRSPEYQAALPTRLRSSQGRVFLIEGM
jgi:uncharacterized protein (DUF1330 family)